MKIRTLIVEDEQNSQELLLNLLSTYCEEVEVVGTSMTVANAKQLIISLQPDLVLLDIELQDGSGFDLLKNFPEFQFITIFITGYDQYGIDAIKHSAVDYILKPFSIIDLQKAIARATSRMQPWELLKQKEDNTSPIGDDNLGKLVLSAEKETRVINHQEILYISADAPYCRLVLQDNTQILVQFSITNILERLPDYFLKIHRSHVINLKKVTKWDRGRGGNVMLNKEIKLPISYRLKNEFLTAIEKLNAKKN